MSCGTVPAVSWGGTHWLRPNRETACAGPGDLATPAMGGVTCRFCREAIDFEIDVIATRLAPPGVPDEWAEGTPVPAPRYRVPPPLPESAVWEALAALNDELEDACSLR